MILVLDTSAYRANSQNGLRFSGLTRLCNHNLIQLKIPFVVEQETVSQKKEAATSLFNAAQSALRDLSASPSLTPDQVDGIQQFEASMRDLGGTAASTGIEETWSYWKQLANTETLGLTSKQSENAIFSYIEGTGGVSSPKNRKDIPDSFIYEQIRELAAEEEVTVVVGDGNLRKALGKLPNVTVFEKLSDFLDSDRVRELFLQLTDKEMEINPTRIMSFLQGNSDALEAAVSDQGGDKIVDARLPFDHPSENPYEHTISSYGELTDIAFKFEELQYYGGGEYGLPFEFSSEVLVEYFIDKSEYWSMDEEDQPSVTDWNDYVYQAESEQEVRVGGMLKISAPLEVFQELLGGSDDVDISSFDVDVDSIESIETDAG